MASFFVLSHKANFRLHWSNQRSLSLTEKLQFLFALTSTSFFVLSHKANFRLPLEQSAFASCSLKSSSLFSSHPSFISCPYRTRQTRVCHWSNQRSLPLTEKLHKKAHKLCFFCFCIFIFLSGENAYKPFTVLTFSNILS